MTENSTFTLSLRGSHERWEVWELRGGGVDSQGGWNSGFGTQDFDRELRLGIASGLVYSDFDSVG
eukprot:1345360-Amorphochlora_amoeboformis.AAC.1